MCYVSVRTSWFAYEKQRNFDLENTDKVWTQTTTRSIDINMIKIVFVHFLHTSLCEVNVRL